jgi:hypothetical protein
LSGLPLRYYLADRDLFIGLRGKSLDIYYRGQRLFHVAFLLPDLKVTTHAKYLVDPELADQVELRNQRFKVGEIGFVDKYDGKTTLSKMKSAAAIYSGLEKTGCHEIAVRNSDVIDWEIAFSDGARAPRVDLAVLKEEGNDAHLVFWEAKHFSNSDLRAEPERLPAVCHQIKEYERYLSNHRQEIEHSYKRVVADLAAIDKMRTANGKLSSLATDVANGRPLTLGGRPRVGLIIFGFDRAQRDDPFWKVHLDRLKQHICVVRTVGDAKGLRIYP